MDEEFDLAPRCQEESCTITDETRQVACATDTPHRWTPDRTLDDVVRMQLSYQAGPARW